MRSPSTPSDQSRVNRRQFIVETLASAGALGLMALHPSLSTANGLPNKKQYTVQEIIDIILKEGSLSPKEDTVDTIKAGRGDKVVSGIVTTMFPTITVIEEAAKRGANFIVAHEPSFYNHRDDAPWATSTAVVKQKKQLLEKHDIAIWRFHDYCHALKPDAITYGVVKKADWLPYFKSGQSILTIPPLSLAQLVEHLKSTLGIAHLRMIGKADQQCQRIALLPGAWGGQMQISLADAEVPDVLIVGEVSEWETAEYIRDARLLEVRPL
jgi:putative NIF3 family GTP cyclohydrolase 1 type 2